MTTDTFAPTSLSTGARALDGTAFGRPSEEKLRAAAEEFESVFIAQILRGMSSGLEPGGALGGADSGPFADMLQDEYARLISRSGGIGVGDAVLKEMLKMQETG
ncbi:MAG: hypothetical protein KDE35_01190 [Geminicoccaceae bacterium]|nr:hypothetical protein [Geminicoccaceae bacterium]